MAKNQKSKKSIETDFANQLNDWGLVFNAKKNFFRYLKDIMNSPLYYDCEIFKIIDEIVLSDDSGQQFKKTLVPGTKLYRAREIPIRDFDSDNGLLVSQGDDGEFITSGYNATNSVEPPLRWSKEGRNNIAGISYLYASEDAVTACAEVKTPVRSLISLAELEVLQELSIIDFSRDVAFQRELSDENGMALGVFFTLLMSEFSIPDRDAYRFTQIVSDYLRKSGADGFSYKSFYTQKINYTIFNSHRSKIQFNGSRILSHHFSNDVFWDFNNQKALMSCGDADLEYDKDVADEMLGHIAHKPEGE